MTDRVKVDCANCGEKDTPAGHRCKGDFKVPCNGDGDPISQKDIDCYDLVHYLGSGAERNPNIYVAMDKASRIWAKYFRYP